MKFIWAAIVIASMNAHAEQATLTIVAGQQRLVLSQS